MNQKKLLWLVIFIFSFFGLISCKDNQIVDPTDNSNDGPAPVYNFKTSDQLRNDLDNFSITITTTGGVNIMIEEDHNAIYVKDLTDLQGISYVYIKNYQQFFQIYDNKYTLLSSKEDAINQIGLYINYYYDSFMGLPSTFHKEFVSEIELFTFIGRQVVSYEAFELINGILIRYLFYVDISTGVTLYLESFIGEKVDQTLTVWQATSFTAGKTDLSKHYK